MAHLTPLDRPAGYWAQWVNVAMKFASVSPRLGADATETMDKLDSLIGSGDLHSRFEEASQLFSDLCGEGDQLISRFIIDSCRTGVWPEVAGAQSFRLMMTKNIIVRLNLWYPPDNAEKPLDSYRRYLSIDELHNHDFEFFTSCVFGPGYTTTLYRDDNHHENRIKGEKVDLSLVGTRRVAPKEIVFFEIGKDYHEQHWPEAFSVTLNVISRFLAKDHRVQYILNRDHTIRTVIDTRSD